MNQWLDEKGFTLVELLVTMVISAILLIAAGTWFGDMTKNVFRMGWDADQQRAVQTVLDLFAEDARTGALAIYDGQDANTTGGTSITVRNSSGNDLYAYDQVGINIRRTVGGAATMNLISQHARNSGVTVVNLNFATVPDGAPGLSTKQKVQMTLVTRVGNDTIANPVKTHVVETSLRNAVPVDWSSP